MNCPSLFILNHPRIRIVKRLFYHYSFPGILSGLLFINTSIFNGNPYPPSYPSFFTGFPDTTKPGPQKDSPGNFVHVYLTFDDGPTAGSEIINCIAASDSAMINVFVIGQNVFATTKQNELLRLYRANPFIEIGNHSYSHAARHYRIYYRHPFQVANDFDRNADMLQLTNKIARLPGRNTWRIRGRRRTDLSDANAAADSLAARGYSVFGWDVEWRLDPDSSGRVQTAGTLIKLIEKLVRRKKTFTPGNVVILCHDPMFREDCNESELAAFIKEIKTKNGYHFEHLSRYPP